MKPAENGIFRGFSGDSLKFFAELEANNSKQWFEANRQRYNDLYDLFTALVLSMNETMLMIDPEFEVNPKKAVSRIYRDIRFSRDKTPYKTCMWFSYKWPGADMNEFPVYFFELSAGMYRYGMGFYAATKRALDAYRSGIKKDPGGFTAMVKALDKKKFYPEGEMYKKRIDNSLPDHLQDWFQRKNLYFMKTCDIDEKIFSPGIVKLLEKDFMALRPFYEFLCSALGG